MAIPVETIFQKTMTSEARLAAKARGEELVNQYLTLQQIRRIRNLTQVQLGQLLGKDQVAISQLEKRRDMLLSTLNNYVRAMGGELKITIEFPNSRPVFLKGMTENRSSHTSQEKRLD
jgi:transcriptional regulator with XRE-family HTH domain